jgi:endoglucanase
MRGRWHAAIALFGAALAVGLGCLPSAANVAAPSFKRGATLVEFFQFPATTGEGSAKRYTDPAYPHALSSLSLFDFAELRRLGFDHMRIPLDVGPLMEDDEPRRQAALNDLIAVISEINRHGLGVVVPLFPPSLHHELPEFYLDGLNGPKFQAYAAIVERVAAALASVKTGPVALEPMNEPQTKCHVLFGTDWTSYQDVMIRRIRRIAPDLPLFLAGGCWTDIDGVVLLDTDLLRDRRNFVSVHFYHPFLFTHQGSWWTLPYLAGTIGVPYPASAGSLPRTLALTRDRFKTVTLPADADRVASEQKAENEIRRYFDDGKGPDQIENRMKKLADWQRREQVDSDRIVFTEFGAIKQTIGDVEIDRDSRARWLHDTSSAIERHGWGWTAFVLRDDPFGLYVHESDGFPDFRLLRALGLDVPKDALEGEPRAGH